MKIHHIGYTVKDIDTAMGDFVLLGYSAIGEKCLDDKRNIIIQFMRNGDYIIELVAPANDASPVTNILKKLGSTPYHVCYETDDIHASVAELKSAGFMVIAEPLEAPAIEIRKVAFLFKNAVGIIELVSTH